MGCSLHRYVVNNYKSLLFGTCIGKDESILSNLRQYRLQHRYLDVLVADAARCVWRQGELFDAIITDRECIVGFNIEFSHKKFSHFIILCCVYTIGLQNFLVMQTK